MKSSFIYEFGPYRFNPRQQELMLQDTTVSLPATLNKLLLMFVSRPSDLITRAELATSIWGDSVNVDIENGINGVIRRLRTQLTRSAGAAGSEAYIQTVVGSGYRFIVPVTVLPEACEAVLDGVAAPSGVVAAVPEIQDVPSARAVPHVRKMPLWIAGAALLLLAGVAALLLHRIGVARVPAAGAELQQWQPITSDDVEDNLAAAAVSADGSQIAYVDRNGLTFQPVSGGKSWTQPLLPGFQAHRLAWFRKGDRLLLSGVQGAQRQVWTVPVGEGRPALWMADADMAVPSPDGSSVAYLRVDRSELWTADADGQGQRQLVPAKAGEQITWLVWAASGDHLLVSRSRSAPDDARAAQGALAQLREEQAHTYASYRASSGRLLSQQANVPFETGLLLPDGRILYTHYSQRQPLDVATAQTDPETGALLLDERTATLPVLGIEAYKASSFTATADGRTVAAILERPAADVYAGELHLESKPALTGIHRVTHRTFTAYPTAWSPDGKSLLFDEGDGGHSMISRIGADGTGRETLADMGARDVSGQYTPDGKWVLFLHSAGPASKALSIRRIPSTGGKPELVYQAPGLLDFHCSRSSYGRCVVREHAADGALVFFELSAESGRGRELLRTPHQASAFGDWSMSPDGQSIASPERDDEHPSVAVRRLDNGDRTHLARFPVEGRGTILGASWAANGRGLFVQTYTDPVYHLLYVDARGATELLSGPGPVWGIASRDGRYLAFPASTQQNRNVWIAQVQPLTR